MKMGSIDAEQGGTLCCLNESPSSYVSQMKDDRMLLGLGIFS